ncbi:putative transporter small subunit [Aliidiomarina quisquiliarum]|nr:putative transporter small subunit [Aliidiomarina quisquiliarum]
MSSFWLTVYVLIWPVIATGVFLTLCVSLVIDIKAAKKSGKSLV